MIREYRFESIPRQESGPRAPARRRWNRLGALLSAPLFFALLAGCNTSPGTAPETPPGRMTPEERIQSGQFDFEAMTPKEMAEVGEVIIFGRLTGGHPTAADVGKGLCPLCHNVTGDVPRNAAPDLTATDPTGLPIAKRGMIRIRDSRYRSGDFAQQEARPGSGRAETDLEYIAESHICPSCYVVSGFGVKGSGDRKSPMVALYLPPNCMTIEESIMVDTYLYMKDGLNPPPPGAIRAVYEKFLPASNPVPPGCRR
jgi:hypothetical protein